jgi:hypothetical protein
MTSPSIPRLALRSARRFAWLCLGGALRLRRARLGTAYDLGSRGTYVVFRETVSTGETAGKPSVVLVVGFRLRVIGASSPAHRLFQRCCILTTPFWSGFAGFRVKLWMVDPDTEDYLGIYEWRGREQAQVYVDALVRVLRPLSVSGSVWYEILDEPFEQYLSDHLRRQSAARSTPA